MDEIQVTEMRFPAAGIELSGIIAAPRDGAPRAVVFGLPGGGMRAGFFHSRAEPRLSLVSLGAALGFTVIALDRPGYGASANALGGRITMPDQARILYAMYDEYARAHPVGAGLCLVAHSFGMEVTLQMAALERGAELVGIDCSGVGIRFGPELAAMRAGVPPERAIASRERQRELFWGPDALYPPGTISAANLPVADVPPVEALETQQWPDVYPALAREVRVPIRISMADHEQWWPIDPQTLAQTRALFVNSPRVEVAIQPHAGHNISLGRVARAYHLKAFAFFEECLLARELGLRA
ncbi:MAG: alpha/beta hydrolase family protein [Gammaproteobacteria bacterium]